MANVFAWAAQSLILVAVSALMPIVLRVHCARPQLIVSQTVLFGMFVLPFVQPWKQPMFEAPVATANFFTAPAIEAVEALPTTAPLDWEKISVYVLLAGMFARGLWLAAGLMRLRRYRRYAEPLPMHSEIPVAVSSDVSGPVTFGLLKPIVLVPPMFSEMPDEQQRSVLTHEFLHVRRRDWLFCLAEEVACTMMWFHPAVWFLVRRIRALREQVVDEAAIAITGDTRPYVEALLTMARIRPMLDVAAAPFFLRKRDLTNRVKHILKGSSMSMRRIVYSYACVALVLVAAGLYSTSTFPLTAAPMQNESVVRGVLTRIDVSRLPQPLQSRVDLHLAAYRNVPFTTDLMLRIKADTAAMDPKIEQNWVEEAPRVYSVWFAYRTDEKVTEPRLVRVDTSRVPEPLRSQVQARMNPFLNAPYTSGLIDSMQSAVSHLDAKIAHKWSIEPDRNVSVTFLYDAPVESWQPVGGILARIDVSSLAEPERSLMQERMAIYVNAPFTNALMREISNTSLEVSKTLGVSKNWGMMWRTEASGIFSLIIGRPDSAALSAQIESQPAQSAPAEFPADGEKQIRLGGGVQTHKLKSAPPPIYPPLALQARIQGVVRFDVQIGKDGRVKRMQIVNGHPLLVEAAKESLSRYEYEPTLLNGEPVQVLTMVDINFRL